MCDSQLYSVNGRPPSWAVNGGLFAAEGQVCGTEPATLPPRLCRGAQVFWNIDQYDLHLPCYNIISGVLNHPAEKKNILARKIQIN